MRIRIQIEPLKTENNLKFALDLDPLMNFSTSWIRIKMIRIRHTVHTDPEHCGYLGQWIDLDEGRLLTTVCCDGMRHFKTIFKELLIA